MLYFPRCVNSIKRQTNLYGFVVIFINKHRYLLSCGFMDLFKPLRLVGPALFVVFALDCMVGDVDISQICLLILV